MNYLNILLEFFSFFALISALATITSTNAVIAIVFLIVLFLNVALYLILLGLNFIGLSYLLVYVGAITVLFLFIVMMLSTDVVSTVEVGTNYSKLLPLSYTLAVLFIILFILTIPSFLADFTIFNLEEILNNFFVDSQILNNDSINKYFFYTNNVDLITVNAFGEPSTLLHKNLQINSIGQSIYGYYSILLILSSFLLLLAMVAPILLARNNPIENKV